jgi:hypothetical protein
VLRESGNVEFAQGIDVKLTYTFSGRARENRTSAFVCLKGRNAP